MKAQLPSRHVLRSVSLLRVSDASSDWGRQALDRRNSTLPELHFKIEGSVPLVQERSFLLLISIGYGNLPRQSPFNHKALDKRSASQDAGLDNESGGRISIKLPASTNASYEMQPECGAARKSTLRWSRLHVSRRQQSKAEIRHGVSAESRCQRTPASFSSGYSPSTRS